MIQKTPQLDAFKERMRGSLLNEAKHSVAIKIGKHNMSTRLETAARRCTLSRMDRSSL